MQNHGGSVVEGGKQECTVMSMPGSTGAARQPKPASSSPKVLFFPWQLRVHSLPQTGPERAGSPVNRPHRQLTHAAEGPYALPGRRLASTQGLDKALPPTRVQRLPLKAHQRQRNDTTHQYPAHVQPSIRHGISDGGISVHDDGCRNDPVARNVRSERGGDDQ